MTAVLSLVVLASALATPPPAFVTPPALSAPALCSTASAAVKRPSFNGGVPIKSTCIADCGDLNGSVSCSGSTCSAVNQDQTCPGGPGYVQCDSQAPIYCPACCTSGIRNVTTGDICSCPDGQSTPKDRYQCVNGLWQYQFSFCGGPFCPGF